MFSVSCLLFSSYAPHGSSNKACADSKKEELSKCADSTAHTKITTPCTCGVNSEETPQTCMVTNKEEELSIKKFCWDVYNNNKRYCVASPQPQICASTDPIKFPVDDKQSMRSGACVCGSGRCFSGGTCTAKDSTCACEPSATVGHDFLFFLLRVLSFHLFTTLTCFSFFNSFPLFYSKPAFRWGRRKRTLLLLRIST